MRKLMKITPCLLDSTVWHFTPPTSKFNPQYGSKLRAPSTHAASPRLDLQAIDRKWQKKWAESGWNQRRKETASKAYVLPMFPYPSGTLHLGHLRVYTIADVLARFHHMRGRDVLFPIGWDAFGLPAENAAIENGVDPATWTLRNIAKMKDQLQAMNGGFDWGREFMTCDPAFYKHTQRIFLLLHERGLAYQADSLVNYDPVDRTVLANEQVDANGFSWRSGAKVEKVNLKQWFLRITAFKEALLSDLDYLGEGGKWPERVLTMQRNWLGKSEGARITFQLKKTAQMDNFNQSVEVFTTRADTLFGAQYIALSLSHPVVTELAKQNQQLQSFLNTAHSLPKDSKAGYLLPDLHATNPLSLLENVPKHVQKPIPVYVAPYVLQDYGKGAVMGVPGHDGRDHAFWQQNRGDEKIIQAIIPTTNTEFGSRENPKLRLEEHPFTAPGHLASTCGDFAGLSSLEASRRIVTELGTIGGHAETTETWKLRDWLISRQRYWGTPIPIIHCSSCGAVPVPVEELPVELPKLGENWFHGKGGNPLESATEWVNTKCPTCGQHAKRDTDTMDTFVDSSWYFMRFPDDHNMQQPFSPEVADVMLPVDIYIGGVEHAILHLLYARFISKFLATTSLWPSGGGIDNLGEPFRNVITQGMVHGKTYSDPETGRFLKQEELDYSNPENPRIKQTNQIPILSWEKMSKSKYNGTDPQSCYQKYGADVTRAHMLFQAPVSDVLQWEEERIVGVQRWFGRIWRLVEEVSALIPEANDTDTDDMENILHLHSTLSIPETEKQILIYVQKTIASVTTSLSKTHSLNTLISDLIKLTNVLFSISTSTSYITLSSSYHSISALLRMLAPIAPAFAEECWERLHVHVHARTTPDSPTTIFSQPFPVPDQTPVRMSTDYPTQVCAIQEDGKLRCTVVIAEAPKELLVKNGKEKESELQEWVLKQIEKTEAGGKWLRGSEKKGKVWKRVIIVKGGKTVNFVG